MDRIFESMTVSNKFLIPISLMAKKLDLKVLGLLNLDLKKYEKINMDNWINLTNKIKNKDKLKKVKIGFLRKYIKNADTYASLIESIHLSGYKLNLNV